MRVWDKVSTLEEIKKRCVIDALTHFIGNKTKTANALGISIRTLRNYIHQYKLYSFFHKTTKYK